jgi:Holliday junction resolvase RusA-like endonuclease
MRIEIDIVPVPKPRMTNSDRWKRRTVVSRYYAFKDELITLCSLKNFKLGDKYKVEFFLPMPKSWSEKQRKEIFGKPHKNKPDLDNLLKALNDCLLDEDEGVHWIEASKIWWDKGKIIIYNIV